MEGPAAGTTLASMTAGLVEVRKTMEVMVVIGALQDLMPPPIQEAVAAALVVQEIPPGAVAVLAPWSPVPRLHPLLRAPF